MPERRSLSFDFIFKNNEILITDLIKLDEKTQTQVLKDPIENINALSNLH